MGSILMRIKRKYESIESKCWKIDKFVRIVLSFILVLTLMRVRDSELTEEILLVLAVLFFSTGLVGYCPFIRWLASVHVESRRNG